MQFAGEAGPLFFLGIDQPGTERFHFLLGAGSLLQLAGERARGGVQLLLRLLTLCDVLADSHEFHRPPAIANPLALAVDHSNFAIGANDPFLKIEGFTLTVGVLYSPPCARPVVRMNPFQIAFVGRFEFTGEQSENPAKLVRSVDAVARNVPFIAA